MVAEKLRCFVIQPFSKTAAHSKTYWKKHFVSMLKPMIEAVPNLEAHISEPLRGDIIRQIIADLVTAPVVVADLTDHNPNVFWELGIRQSFKHGTVTIAQQGTPLPFDIWSKGTLFYDFSDKYGVTDFGERLRAAIGDCLDHPDRADSPILESISGRGTFFEIFRKDEAKRRLDALIREIDWNLKVGELIKKRCEENIADPSKRRYEALRFRIAANGLLITERYAEAVDSFYTAAESVFTWLASANDMLSIWVQKPTPTEKWFLVEDERRKTRLTGLREQAVTIRENIARLV